MKYNNRVRTPYVNTLVKTCIHTHMHAAGTHMDLYGGALKSNSRSVGPPSSMLLAEGCGLGMAASGTPGHRQGGCVNRCVRNLMFCACCLLLALLGPACRAACCPAAISVV